MAVRRATVARLIRRTPAAARSSHREGPARYPGHEAERLCQRRADLLTAAMSGSAGAISTSAPAARMRRSRAITSSRSGLPRMKPSARPVRTNGMSVACAAAERCRYPRRRPVDVVQRLAGFQGRILDRASGQPGADCELDGHGRFAGLVPEPVFEIGETGRSTASTTARAWAASSGVTSAIGARSFICREPSDHVVARSVCPAAKPSARPVERIGERDGPSHAAAAEDPLYPSAPPPCRSWSYSGSTGHGSRVASSTRASGFLSPAPIANWHRASAFASPDLRAFEPVFEIGVDNRQVPRLRPPPMVHGFPMPS